MHNHSARIVLFSSIAIVLLIFEWGLRQIPQQGHLAEQVLRDSLNQESVVLGSAVKAATQSMKYRLLDVLKAEGNDHVTRTFQDSPFFAATLLEWDQVQWKSLWYSVKSKTDMQSSELKKWLAEWPLSKLASDEAYFVKVGDVQGQPHFAILVPVRKPNQVPMVGVGIFPASQFGLAFSADESREVRVFTGSGMALALTHPAYLGASVKGEPIVHEMLERDEVSYRHEWTGERGARMIALAAKVPDTNLYTAIESKSETGSGFFSWIYLMICGLGAVGVNWVLFGYLLRPLLDQLGKSESLNEQLRRTLNEQTLAQVLQKPELVFDSPPEAAVETLIPAATLPQMVFEEEAPPPPPNEVAMEIHDGKISLYKIVRAALGALESRIDALDIQVTHSGLEPIRLKADPLQLQTAIEEVLKNAIEAMGGLHSRRLMITGRMSGELVRLQIEDTGCGISPANLEKVFDPFFSTKDSQGVARGLGLNVARRVIEELSGKLTLESRPDEGTRVEIELPVEMERTLALEELVIPQFTDEPEEFQMQSQPATPPPWPEISIRKPRVRAPD